MLRLRLAAIALLGSSLWAQDSTAPASGGGGNDKSSVPRSQMSSNMHDMHDMHNMPGMNEDGASAMHAMEGHHMDMGPHMKMTSLRPLQAGDREKADEVVQAARTVAEKYQDYKIA